MPTVTSRRLRIAVVSGAVVAMLALAAPPALAHSYRTYISSDHAAASSDHGSATLYDSENRGNSVQVAFLYRTESGITDAIGYTPTESATAFRRPL